jgi:hypothetical protein
MSAADNHTDPMLTTRQCKSCHVWLPCCVIDQVEDRARQEAISSSDLVLAALRDYLGEDLPEDDTESSSC